MESIRKKLEYYCAYQERCQAEVREKLRQFKIYGFQADSIIAQLIEDNFLNEARFAQTFAGGKFRQKQWGRIKIRRALQAKEISQNCIEAALKTEISEEDYWATLLNLVEKHRDKYQNNFQKLYAYLHSKGFEHDYLAKLKEI